MTARRNWRDFLTPEERVEIAASDAAYKRIERERKSWEKKHFARYKIIQNRACQRARHAASHTPSGTTC